MAEPLIILMTARSRTRVLAATLISLGLLVAAPALGGTYGKVNQSDWTQGSTGLPTYVNMYSFVPSTVATKPPIVVYLHHCQGNAASSHSSMSGLESIADKNGFLIIYPEATGENCWDAGSKRSLKNGGGGDTGAIVQMVKHYLSKYSGDATRVYVAGDSSGGIMTEAILGVYPDVFMAGVSIMGVPCGCWGQSDYNDVTGSGGSAQWCGSCAGGSVSKTGAQWGDLVRSYFPGYTGHRPRLQHWHGATDTTLNFKNVAEDIKEWTNLLALPETPTGTEQNTPKSGTTHQFWKNSCYTVYETFVLANTGHMVSVDGATLAKYFGIDTAGGQDPETAACGASAVPGGGSGTPGGTGGAAGSGGAPGSGGAGGGRDGGLVARDGSSDAVSAGGVQGSGGGAEQGGAPGTGGSASGSGGKAGSSGGASGTGGKPGSGGSAGSVAAGGGSVSNGGTSAGGSAGQSSSNGGTSAVGGSVGSGGSAGAGGESDGGCKCSFGGRGRTSTAFLAVLFFGAFVLLSRRRR
jgi:poly(hydroxyalkanoate) depolymerase family esterase